MKIRSPSRPRHEIRSENLIGFFLPSLRCEILETLRLLKAQNKVRAACRIRFTSLSFLSLRLLLSPSATCPDAIIWMDGWLRGSPGVPMMANLPQVSLITRHLVFISAGIHHTTPLCHRERARPPPSSLRSPKAANTRWRRWRRIRQRGILVRIHATFRGMRERDLFQDLIRIKL